MKSLRLPPFEKSSKPIGLCLLLLAKQSAEEVAVMDAVSYSILRQEMAIGQIGTEGDPERFAELIAELLEDPKASGLPIALVGMGRSADLIAMEYYRFFPVARPMAAVLLSPSIGQIHLNNITCPYLIVHGERDDLIRNLPYSRVEDAVYRHQSRYGDFTSNLLVPGVGRNLGGEGIPEDTVLQICEWLRPAIRTGNRPQEPAGKAAA